MHHAEQKEEKKGNIFSEGIHGWSMLFGMFKKKKDDKKDQNQQQPQQQNQQQQPQNQSQ
jgi:hypothetical protein